MPTYHSCTPMLPCSQASRRSGHRVCLCHPQGPARSSEKSGMCAGYRIPVTHSSPLGTRSPAVVTWPSPLVFTSSLFSSYQALSTAYLHRDSNQSPEDTIMSTPTTNQRLVLHKRPEKGPVTSETFKLEKVDLKPLGPGEVLVRVDYSAIVSPSPLITLRSLSLV